MSGISNLSPDPAIKSTGLTPMTEIPAEGIKLQEHWALG